VVVLEVEVLAVLMHQALMHLLQPVLVAVVVDGLMQIPEEMVVPES
jgi:hypothetical protein